MLDFSEHSLTVALLQGTGAQKDVLVVPSQSTMHTIASEQIGM